MKPVPGLFSMPPLIAELGADAACSFTDHTTGVGGGLESAAAPVTVGNQKVVSGVYRSRHRREYSFEYHPPRRCCIVYYGYL